MGNLLAAIRTLIWFPMFYIGTALIVIVAMLIGSFSTSALKAIVRCWPIWHRLCGRLILGQRIAVEGAWPRGAAFVVMKHEAMFETIDLPYLFDYPAVFAKKELFDIPLWGFLARRYGLIPIYRDGGASTLRTMRATAKAAIEAGRPIILFPEGTRVKHGDSPPIHSGFAGVYKMLGMAVTPIAVNSGRLRRGWVRLPGVVTYRVGAEIPPGLPRAEAEARVHSAINALNP
jgi:1-acyl-sn-glycerol-3-phosphate acyltransferase